MARRIWEGTFTMGRIDQGRTDYVLCGALNAPHDGRLVDLRVRRERLESLVINLTAESDLFSGDTSEERLARLRMMAHLGVPDDVARALVYPESSSTPIVDVLSRRDVETLLVTAAEMYDTDGAMDTAGLSERQAELLEKCYTLWKANHLAEQERVYVEPLLSGGQTFGPYTDEVEASQAMDEHGVSDATHKLVWRFVTPCAECGAEIPTRESSEINRHHRQSCSLYPDNAV